MDFFSFICSEFWSSIFMASKNHYVYISMLHYDVMVLPSSYFHYLYFYPDFWGIINKNFIYLQYTTWCFVHLFCFFLNFFETGFSM
jgi:hypothetical protein